MRVGIGYPMIGGISGQVVPSFAMTMAEVSRNCDEFYFFDTLGVVPHDIARSRIMDKAIHFKCDYLFFIDSDQGIPKGAFPRLLKVIQEENAQLVSGHYFRRGYPYSGVWSKKLPNGDISYLWAPEADALCEVLATGLGCALVDVAWVKEHLMEPYFLMQICNEGTMITEDLYFCDKITAAGGKILGDQSVRCSHVHRPLEINDDNVDYLRERDLEIQISLEGLDAARRLS